MTDVKTVVGTVNMDKIVAGVVDPQNGGMNAERYFDIAEHGKTAMMRVDIAVSTPLVAKYCSETKNEH